MGQAPCCCGDPRSGGNEVKVERTAVSTATAPRPPSPDAREETLSTNHLQPGPPITDDAVSDRDVAAMAQQPAAPSPRGRGGGDSTLGMLTQISLAPTGTQVSNTHSHKEQMKEIIRLFWREAMKGINVNIVSLEPNSLSVVPAEFRLSGDKSSFTVTETGEQGGQEGRSLEWPFGQTDYVAKKLGDCAENHTRAARHLRREICVGLQEGRHEGRLCVCEQRRGNEVRIHAEHQLESHRTLKERAIRIQQKRAGGSELGKRTEWN